jgi:hypothetical protein
MPADTLDPALREKLSDYYRPHVEALEARLGRSFDWGL